LIHKFFESKHTVRLHSAIQYNLLSEKIRGKTMEAYCMKCKAKREMKNPEQITMKNGRPATQGVCPLDHCGTKMFKIGSLVL
tara:strand:- start:574 stop:819 length:246 start_codon:yes stop_codon:yes gene_type:complete